jgi:hypothetical protein
MKKIVQILRYSCVALGLSAGAAAADTDYKPYILAQQSQAQAADKLVEVKTALQQAGFSLAGEYSPYDGTHVLAITHDALTNVAAQTEFGVYGAALRVGVTQVGAQVQVSYNNPLYMQHMYRMAGSLENTATTLAQALGNETEFGAKKGMDEKKLRKYHYMFAMPYFNDHLKLADYASHQAALETVEKGLAASKSVRKVYRVDVPGKEAALFGVAILEGDGADKTVMNIIDKGELRHSAHLPYEFVVVGNSAYLLHGKFRIAQSFPDLGMGTFMNISSAPDAIELAIKAAIR